MAKGAVVMNENNQALTSITFNEDGHEKTIDIKNVNWAFEKGGMLYVVENDKKIYTFELSGKDAEDIYESLKKANPDMIVGALMGKRIGFEKLANTRDLGGIQTKDGRFIRPHRLIRSGELHTMSKNDRKRLEKDYDVKMVIDFRTEVERVYQPDPIMLQAVNYHVPARSASSLDSLAGGSRLHMFTEMLRHAKETMERLYEELVVSQQGLKAYRRFFELLLRQENGSILWHCTQGKDRTGVATMLLLSTLGVSKDEIMKDYLQTNIYLKAQKDDLILKLKDHKELVKDLDYLYDASTEYMNIAYRCIAQNFGSVENYLHEGLELDDEDIEKLKDRFLI